MTGMPTVPPRSVNRVTHTSGARRAAGDRGVEHRLVERREPVAARRPPRRPPPPATSPRGRRAPPTPVGDDEGEVGQAPPPHPAQDEHDPCHEGDEAPAGAGAPVAEVAVADPLLVDAAGGP